MILGLQEVRRYEGLASHFPEQSSPHRTQTDHFVTEMLRCLSDMSIAVATGCLFPYFGTRGRDFGAHPSCLSFFFPPMHNTSHHFPGPTSRSSGKDVMNMRGGGKGTCHWAWAPTLFATIVQAEWQSYKLALLVMIQREQGSV